MESLGKKTTAQVSAAMHNLCRPLLLTCDVDVSRVAAEHRSVDQTEPISDTEQVKFPVL